MAELFARLGRKTLLIDADLRKPSISKLMDANTQDAGLTEVLLGHVPLDEAVLDGVHENLTVLSVAGTPANPAELLSSGQLKDFIEEPVGASTAAARF